MSALPTPVTRDQEFLAGVCDRLDQQNVLLSGIRDRLTASPQVQPATEPVVDAAGDDGSALDGGVVELKEPVPPRRSKPTPRKTPTAPKAATGRRGAASTTKEQS